MQTGKIDAIGDNIFAKGAWEKVSETDIVLPTTSVTISGLNGDVDEAYLLRGFFVNNY